MTEIRFYHLQTQTLEEALPALLMKAYGTGKPIILKHPDPIMLEKLNDRLWTFHPNHFLPHGSRKNGNPDLQPIWLTDKDDNPNNAKILVLTGGSTHADIASFDLCCEFLDGQSDEDVKAARARWKIYKEQGFEVTYWQQGEQREWTQKQ